MDMSTAGEQTGGNFSQIIKPDWNRAQVYDRDGNQTIEVTLDSTVKLGFATQPVKDGSYDFNKSYSRSSFLILGAGASYRAYIT